jgi:hypothetical protein
MREKYTPYLPGGKDEGGGEELCLHLDGDVDWLDGLPGGAVSDNDPVAVAVPLPPVLHRFHVVRLPAALLLLSR